MCSIKDIDVFVYRALIVTTGNNEMTITSPRRRGTRSELGNRRIDFPSIRVQIVAIRGCHQWPVSSVSLATGSDANLVANQGSGRMITGVGGRIGQGGPRVGGNVIDIEIGQHYGVVTRVTSVSSAGAVRNINLGLIG
jgi:hypothetical protein